MCKHNWTYRGTSVLWINGEVKTIHVHWCSSCGCLQLNTADGYIDQILTPENLKED